MASLKRMKNEKEKFDSKIKKSQAEIANLKQVIEDTEVRKENQKREYQKEIAELGKNKDTDTAYISDKNLTS